MNESEDEDLQRRVDALREADRTDRLLDALGALWSFVWIGGGLIALLYVLVKFVKWAWGN